MPDVIANKLDHLLILTSGTEQYLITCTNKKYKFLLTTTLTISGRPYLFFVEGVFILCNIWDLLIYSFVFKILLNTASYSFAILSTLKLFTTY